MPPPADLGANFPQLEILEPIGQGGMAWVYKARQIPLDRIVALKVLPPRVAADATFAHRFQQEACALARLSHPNIVAIHDSGQSGPYFFFIMEFVDGTNLRQLQRMRPFAPDEVLRIAPEICNALQYAHDKGTVHRDIKPENILIDSKGRVKIADFGIAKLTSPATGGPMPQEQRPLGTPNYMAPEQLAPPYHVDHRADIFAIGVVLYEMLTGELPIGRFDLPSQGRALDARIDGIIDKALAQRPDRRYMSADELKSDIERLTAAPSPEPPKSPPPQSANSSR